MLGVTFIRIKMVNSDLWAFLPVIDRTVQMLVSLTLEPRFKAVFEPTSYGFRPLRNVGHETARIFKLHDLGRQLIFE